MKYIVIMILLFLLILLIYYFCKKRWAIKKVKCDSDEEKLSYINAVLEPFGFEFDLEQDIVISKNDSWQRILGYQDLYDLKAPFFYMVMDAEPIYFDYDNKHYRLEFWKGQYGITTGAEIGLYVQDLNSKYSKFYRSANDCERINMCFSLYKECFSFSRKDFTWWLTGFEIGKFSKPKDLRLRICIDFPNKEMLVAFVSGLLNAGYTKNKLDINCNNICFDFCSPHNYKLNHKHKIIKFIVQIINRINCSIYMRFTKCFHRTLDKLSFLRYMAPCFYRFIICLCIPRKKQKKYCKKKQKNTQKI